MTTTVHGLTAVALAAALSACATSPLPMRIAATQSTSAQVYRDTIQPLADCEVEYGAFNAPDAMKLPKNAFSSCRRL